MLAVLIMARGEPLDRAAILAAMPTGFRPPTAAQIGAVISHLRHKVGRARILTGAGGWWLRDPAETHHDGPDLLRYGDLCLDVTRRYARLEASGRTIRLGHQESVVLRVLLEARGLPRSGRDIWSSLPPEHRPRTVRGVGVVVACLRRRLGRHAITTGGGGWRLAGPPSVRPDHTTWGGLRLDNMAREVWTDGQAKPVRLSSREAAVLGMLLEARGEPRRATHLWAGLPVERRPKSANAVSTVISRLRAKLGPDQVVTSGDGWFLADRRGLTALAPAYPRRARVRCADDRVIRTDPSGWYHGCPV
ncbi:winged helix-turn-helix domain-containing protein [Micromonospora thermarum]|uniref:OmpR/PhoB-type domain-containing protein n=1 Tax=Micromonospora thermarum TaxID=2720024 RepID=A0ABX0Z6T1_9ACTN|nr:winged helix-turn-helix domain-containing protein [Micromonospora thermarum]NJP31951.1 hypothetical protein [Micromonospora thermarum]